MASFCIPEACGQTELPERSAVIGQKMVENAKIEKFKCYILGDYQTLCTILIELYLYVYVIRQSVYYFQLNAQENLSRQFWLFYAI